MRTNLVIWSESIKKKKEEKKDSRLLGLFVGKGSKE